MDCSVVIPCHNGAALTQLCLESLLQQRGDHRLEILLVDNASTDDTDSLASLDPRIRTLRQDRNLGFAAGVNRGLQAAQHPFVLVLNNDTQAASNMLEQMQTAIESDERIGAVSVVSNWVKGTARLEVGRQTRNPAQREALARELLAGSHWLQDTDTLTGLGLLLRRRALDEVGGFDERFGHGNFEDDDLCLRLRLHGYRLVVARRAFLHHEGHATFDALGIDYKKQIRERYVQFKEKWEEEPAGRAYFASLAQQLARAAEHAVEARVQWPRWADADRHEGNWRLGIGEYERAAAHLRTFLAHSPYHLEAAIDLAIALLSAQDFDGARQQLQWVAENLHVPAPVQRDLSSRIGKLHGAWRQWTTAETYFRQAIELAPDCGESHNWLGLCLLEQGRHTEAEAEFEEAAELGFAPAHTNLGICAFRRGEHLEAERQFTRACDRMPDDDDARTNLEKLRQTRPVACRHAKPAPRP